MKPQRIQIDGVWYVPEVKDEITDISNQIVEALSYHYESDDYSFVASITKSSETGEYYKDIDIEFTDKRVKPFKTEFWDHNGWMWGVYENNPESLETLIKESNMDQDGINQLRSFLNYLVDKAWLTKK
jgi:hypothetical protein